MIPAAFDYHVPTSIAEATALLARLGDDAKVLSGGQSLIPMMKLRLATPAHLVDINRIPGLASLAEADGVLKIGALTRESDLEESDLVRTRYPILLDTCRVIADPLVRNLATVGGNLAHGDPANDHPATMLALGAEVVAVGAGWGAADPDRRLLHRSVRDGAGSRGDPGRDPGAGPGGAERRRLPRTGAEGRRLRDGRGGGPAWPRCRGAPARRPASA